LLPALFFGYVIPTILMLTPHENPDFWQSVIALGRFAPLIASLLISFIASLISRAGPPQDPDPFQLRELDNTDVPCLRMAYSVVFSEAAAVHIWTFI
jgi:hypothetical protein